MQDLLHFQYFTLPHCERGQCSNGLQKSRTS